MWARMLCVWAGVLWVVASGAIAVSAEAGDYALDVTEQEDRDRLEIVKSFADNVMDKTRDRYGETHTPAVRGRPERGDHGTGAQEGNEWIISNQANQQNPFRTLTGLANLTGEERYKAEAKAAIEHMFEYQRSEFGLLYWDFPKTPAPFNLPHKKRPNARKIWVYRACVSG